MKLELIFTLLGITLAQSNDCLYLDSSSLCGPDFIDQPVIRKIGTVEFESVKGFNEILSQQFLNPTNLAETYNTELNCSKEDFISQFKTIRFQLSFQCSFYVQRAINTTKCPPRSNTVPNGTLLCRTPCDIYQRSINNIISSPICTLSSKASEFSLAISFICAEFASYSERNTNKYCTNGTENEYKNCGWSSFEIGRKYCSEMPQKDNCCNKLLRMGTVSSSGLETKGFLWWHILLIVLAGVILIGGILFAIFCRKNRKNPIKNVDKMSHVKAEEGQLTSDTSTKISEKVDQMNFDTADEGQAKSENPSKNPEKGKKSNMRGRAQVKRTLKNKTTIADDLAKERAKGDQSINSLMKFFGVGSVKYKKPSVDVSSRLQVTFASDIDEYDRSEDESELFKKVPPTKLKTMTQPNAENSSVTHTQKDTEAIKKKSEPDPSTSPYVADSIPETKQESDTMKTVVVIQTYEATGPDELNLVIGELIHVKQEFDDGWAVGIEQRSKKEGVFPLMYIGNLVIPSTTE